MSTAALLEQERRHLADLIEAIQRCVYFLDAADGRLEWSLDPAMLALRGMLYHAAREFVSHCYVVLGISPSSNDFTTEFTAIVGRDATL